MLFLDVARQIMLSPDCEALVARREDIVWDIGGVRQPPLPLERMVREAPDTPFDVPMHPAAAGVWQRHGFT